MRGDKKSVSDYWSRNIRRLLVLLAVWFVGSYGLGILLVEELDQFWFFGVPLGFWFAQQGSIYVFLILILVYVVSMNRLDDEYDSSEESQASQDATSGGGEIPRSSGEATSRGETTRGEEEPVA